MNKTIAEIKKMSFQDAYSYLQEEDAGDWDSVNSEDIIKQYCAEMMNNGTHVSHILQALEENPSSEEVYNIWLGNSMETPTPINNVEELIEALGIEDTPLKKFEVFFEKTFTLSISVEAEDEDDAQEKADAILSDKTKEELLEMSQEGYFEYTYTDEV